MHIKATDITPKKQNLAIGEFGPGYYDLHNEFDCLKLVLANGVLSLLTQHSEDRYYVVMRFYEVEIKTLEFDPLNKLEALAMIYRGTWPTDDSQDLKPKFYVHFTNHDLIGFLTDSISINRYNEIPDDLKDGVINF